MATQCHRHLLMGSALETEGRPPAADWIMRTRGGEGDDNGDGNFPGRLPVRRPSRRRARRRRGVRPVQSIDHMRATSGISTKSRTPAGRPTSSPPHRSRLKRRGRLRRCRPPTPCQRTRLRPEAGRKTTQAEWTPWTGTRPGKSVDRKGASR